MKIDLQRIPTDFQGERCFVHARGAMDKEGRFLITTQPLRLSGSDIFYGMHTITSTDGGKSWSAITPSKTLVRMPHAAVPGWEVCLCDLTPMYHKKTGRFLATGHTAIYENDEFPAPPYERDTGWTVFDEQTGDWRPLRFLGKPQGGEFYNCGSGCCQCVELESGDVLVPVYFQDKKAAADPWHSCSGVAVFRCAFDGEELCFVEAGNTLSVQMPRGLGEPSVTAYGGAYYLCIRNDVTGYVSRSADGLHFDPPQELCFDDGTNLGNYNTQQHWITGGGKLWLVYTRRGADNDHVFRHRAPLFIAEFDPEHMCVIRATERIVVPERGARLGNFGCFSVSDTESYVIAAEWMQTTEPDWFNWRRCMEYGSDNSIFIAKLTF